MDAEIDKGNLVARLSTRVFLTTPYNLHKHTPYRTAPCVELMSSSTPDNTGTVTWSLCPVARVA
jgi:hypothetical protein